MDEKIEELRRACVAYQGADESHKRGIFRNISEVVRSIAWPGSPLPTITQTSGGVTEATPIDEDPIEDTEQGTGADDTAGGD